MGPSEEVCLSGMSTASVVYKYCLYMPLQNQLISAMAFHCCVCITSMQVRVRVTVRARTGMNTRGFMHYSAIMFVHI